MPKCAAGVRFTSLRERCPTWINGGYPVCASDTSTVLCTRSPISWPTWKASNRPCLISARHSTRRPFAMPCSNRASCAAGSTSADRLFQPCCRARVRARSSTTTSRSRRSLGPVHGTCSAQGRVARRRVVPERRGFVDWHTIRPRINPFPISSAYTRCLPGFSDQTVIGVCALCVIARTLETEWNTSGRRGQSVSATLPEVGASVRGSLPISDVVSRKRCAVR